MLGGGGCVTSGARAAAASKALRGGGGVRGVCVWRKGELDHLKCDVF